MIQPETTNEIQHVGAIITTIAMKNEKPITEHITPFDSAVVPQLSFARYMQHVGKYTNGTMCGPVFSAVAMVIYARRIQKKRPNFKITLQNMHRLYLAAVVVSQKFFSDQGLLNSYYARVGGVSLRELNRLEVTLLSWLNWDAKVTTREYYDMCSRLNVVKVPINVVAQNALVNEAERQQQQHVCVEPRFSDGKKAQIED